MLEVDTRCAPNCVQAEAICWSVSHAVNVQLRLSVSEEAASRLIINSKSLSEFGKISVDRFIPKAIKKTSIVRFSALHFFTVFRSATPQNCK
jgi:hypothetical protein